MAGTPPPFTPPAGAVAQVSIIDSTSSMKNAPVSFLMTPPVPGFDLLPDIPAWSFLIESSDGRKALFDLGVPPDWETGFAPAIAERVKGYGWDINVDKDVHDILKDGGTDPHSIGSIVWSHWHWDHIGDPSTFPSTTEVVVGPGFKKEFSPYYPQKADAPIKQSYFDGRTLREVDFDNHSTLTIGPYRALDFFGDGSFYLLDTPGHAVGHLGGLVRTTSNPDTFLLLGGDLCHHSGEIRPSPYLPIPSEVSPTGLSNMRYPGGVCPGADFEALNTRRNRAPNRPFFDPAIGLDIPQAIRTIEKTQEPDADDNILFIFAHDEKIRDVVEFFPKKANEWKQKGWKQTLLWKFLEDFKGSISIAA